MSSEREEFSARLKQALQDAGHPAFGPTELAYEFNLRFSARPVSIHAARKWLMGEAIPTQEKIRVLSNWLMVPADWLRFGGHELGRVAGEKIDPVYRRLINDLEELDVHHRKLVMEIARVIIRLSATKGSRRP